MTRIIQKNNNIYLNQQFEGLKHYQLESNIIVPQV